MWSQLVRKRQILPGPYYWGYLAYLYKKPFVRNFLITLVKTENLLPQSHPVNPTSHWQSPVLLSHFPLLEHPLGQTEIWALMFKSVIPLLFQNCCTVLRIGSLWLKGISEHLVWFKFVALSEQPSSNQLNPPWQGL